MRVSMCVLSIYIKIVTLCVEMICNMQCYEFSRRISFYFHNRLDDTAAVACDGNSAVNRRSRHSSTVIEKKECRKHETHYPHWTSSSSAQHNRRLFVYLLLSQAIVVCYIFGIFINEKVTKYLTLSAGKQHFGNRHRFFDAYLNGFLLCR